MCSALRSCAAFGQKLRLAIGAIWRENWNEPIFGIPERRPPVGLVFFRVIPFLIPEHQQWKRCPPANIEPLSSPGRSWKTYYFPSSIFLVGSKWRECSLFPPQLHYDLVALENIMGPVEPNLKSFWIWWVRDPKMAGGLLLYVAQSQQSERKRKM